MNALIMAIAGWGASSSVMPSDPITVETTSTVVVSTTVRGESSANQNTGDCDELASALISSNGDISGTGDLTCPGAHLASVLVHHIVYSPDITPSAMLLNGIEEALSQRDGPPLLDLLENNKLSVQSQLDQLLVTADRVDRAIELLNVRRLSDASPDPMLEPESVNVMRPAFQWAQAADAIFVNLKFSRTMTSPGANIPKENIRVTLTPTEITVEADHPKDGIYLLRLPLRNSIDPEKSSFNLGSVSKLQLTLAKMEPDIWEGLVDANWEGGKIGFWFDMAERYSYGEKVFFSVPVQEHDEL